MMTLYNHLGGLGIDVGFGYRYTAGPGWCGLLNMLA